MAIRNARSSGLSHALVSIRRGALANGASSGRFRSSAAVSLCNSRRTSATSAVLA
jgi:hypothetical protein